MEGGAVFPLPSWCLRLAVQKNERVPRRNPSGFTINMGLILTIILSSNLGDPGSNEKASIMAIDSFSLSPFLAPNPRNFIGLPRWLPQRASPLDRSRNQTPMRRESFRPSGALRRQQRPRVRAGLWGSWGPWGVGEKGQTRSVLDLDPGLPKRGNLW